MILDPNNPITQFLLIIGWGLSGIVITIAVMALTNAWRYNG